MSQSDKPWILGLSYSHNGSACLLRGNDLVVAIQEERLTRHKRQRLKAGCESLAISYCLDHAGITLADLDAIAVSALPPEEEFFAQVRGNPQLGPLLDSVPVLAFSHHVTHAAYVAAVTGVERATIVIADGMGSPYNALSEQEKEVTVAAIAPINGRKVGLAEMLSVYTVDRGRLTPVFKQMTSRLDAHHIGRPGKHGIPGTANRYGLGAMYERSSEVIFGGSQQAGKVMGLAPFGRPSLPVEAFHTVRDDQALQFSNPDVLKLDYSTPCQTTMDPTDPEAQNLAAAVQQALEHGMLHYARHAHELTGNDTLLLGGGVALNGVANENIIRASAFRKVHVPPAVEDSGNSVGAAYLALWQRHGWSRATELRVDAIGKTYALPEIDAAIAATPFVQAEILGDRLVDDIVARLERGDIVGWFQGGSELGPRALGQRSILCDPRPAEAKARLNAKVKHREAFRPFAPMVLADHAAEWFDLAPDVDPDGPFMTRVVSIQKDKRSLVPAVTHVDGTGRFQTISPENGLIFDLITAFHQRTGVPILLNTSFNLAGEPIIETPSDALFDLLATDLDGVVLQDRFVWRQADRTPGFTDLVPEIIGEFLPEDEAKIARLTGVVFNSLGDDSFDSLCYRVQTAHGAALMSLDQTSLPLVSLIDGTKTVGQIAATAHPLLAANGCSPAYLESIIATLTRKKMLVLRCPESGALLKV